MKLTFPMKETGILTSKNFRKNSLGDFNVNNYIHVLTEEEQVEISEDFKEDS